MAAIQGLVSTVCELGTAALWFVSQKPIAFEEALLFGIGAGSFETLAVVAYAAWRQARGTEESEDLIEEWRENAPRSFWVRYHLAIERLAALLGHVGARGLVALGVSSASLAQGLVLMLLPVTTFSTVDGVASFGMARGWRWLDPRVARRFYSFVLLVGTLELALFVALANA